jgi:hypothetical protein
MRPRLDRSVPFDVSDFLDIKGDNLTKLVARLAS